MITATPHLSAADLVRALDALDMEQIELARLLEVNPVTVRRWVRDGGEAPGYASLFVRLLLERPELREVVGARRRSGRGQPVRPRKSSGKGAEGGVRRSAGD